MNREEEWILELDGDVSLIRRKKGRKDKREPIDGTLVLETLIYVLKQALDLRIDSKKKEKKLRAKR